jgi:aminopeptidase N
MLAIPVNSMLRVLNRTSIALLCIIMNTEARAQESAPTRADTLRGSYTTPGRNWWDVTFYDLHVTVNPADSTIHGYNAISYRALRSGRELQIDLMEPLVVDSMVQEGRRVRVRKDGNAYFASVGQGRPTNGRPTTGRPTNQITVYYHGKPHVAVRPPWQGGFSWTADSLGRAWVVTTDQGMGASVWWPNKDTQADEPDSQRVALTVPDSLMNISNGRLRAVTTQNGWSTWEWFVKNPINNYAIAVGLGNYAHFGDIYHGEKGPLTIDYWPLDYHLEAARRQFPQTITMLACFEKWFGPYPFYEDGFKLIEVPNNGMEHQSAIAYGNRYANGYQGRDGSGTGLGMKWDFIIVHEAAHEWFGNNITTKDLADMWVHESFANYSENLYTECLFGKEDGARYVIGTRRQIGNRNPIIPAHYGVNAQGSGDMYPKGGNLLHTIRQIVGDDEKWRQILRGLNQTFWHQTVTGKQVEEYISRKAGMDFSKIFDQYLRTIMIPQLEYRIEGNGLQYRWTNVVPGFDMPVEVTVKRSEQDSGVTARIRPTEQWQTNWQTLTGDPPVTSLEVDPDYYVTARRVE